MYHRLFVGRLVIGQVLTVLDQGLAQPGHVAVAEDTPNALNEAPFSAVAFAVLALQVFDDRLRQCQPNGILGFVELHLFLPAGRQTAPSALF